MTIQAARQMGAMILLLVIVAVVIVVVAVVIQLVRRRLKSVATLGLWLGGLLAAYTVALVLVGLASSARQLSVGDIKCFDDWCAGTTSLHRTNAGGVIVSVRLENRGAGRAMKSNLARAYVEVPGGAPIAPADGTVMQTVIPAGGHADVRLTFAANAATPGARFVISEGSDAISPGTFTIGDEVSPFHARAGWPLRV